MTVNQMDFISGFIVHQGNLQSNSSMINDAINGCIKRSFLCYVYNLDNYN